jgi:WD40 repeat protein/predicted Ser/Thr protein kinase
MMPAEARCPKCGAELTNSSAGSACPRCAGESGGANKPSNGTRKVVDKTTIITSSPKTRSTPAPASAPGVKGRFFANYELLEEIAQGGMGIIYKARDLNLNRTVALKMILWGQHASDADVKRFLSEAEAASNLDHPNIVPIFAVGEHEGRHYFSMRYIEGGNLDEHLVRYAKDLPLTVKLMATTARAIHYAHQRGILHRDLKPANIMLDAEGQPHVADFGLAKKVKGDANATHTGVIMGSPNFMSPEQAAGENTRLTTATDVYSLGAVLYLLLTGRPPFESNSPVETLRRLTEEEAESPRDVNPQVDRDLETICLKCLEKDPQHRYGSAEGLAEDLERWLRHEPIAARPTGPMERGAKWAKRHPARAALIAVSLAAIVAIVVMDQDNKARNLVLRQRAEAARDDAMKERENAMKESKRAMELAETSRRQLEQIKNGTGLRLLDKGDSSGALLWFVDALKLDQGGASHEENDRVRIGTVIQQCPMLVNLWTNQDPFSSVVESPDGKRFAIFTRQSVRIWDSQTGTNLLGPIKIPFNEGGAALSPDGTKLLMAAGGSTAQIISLTGGKSAHTVLPLGNPLAFAAFSLDGRRVLAVTGGGRLRSMASEARVWDAVTGQAVSPLLVHSNTLTFAAFGPDGSRVATASTDRTAKVWNASTGELICTLTHKDRVLRAAFSPDGRLVATASQDKTARVWDAESGQPVSSLLVHNVAVIDARFSPDGRRVVTANSDNAARVWEATTGDPITPSLHHDARITSAVFSPDGRRIVSSAEKMVRVWDAASTSVELVMPPLVSNDDILHVAQSADGRRLTIVSRDRTVRVWDVAIDRELPAISFVHQGPVNQARFSANGQRTLSASEDGGLSVRGAPGAGPSENFEHGAPVRAAVFGPDGKFVASLSGTEPRNQTLQVWNLEDRPARPEGGPPRPNSRPPRPEDRGPRRDRLRYEMKHLEGGTFSPDGKWLVAADKNRHWQLIELANGKTNVLSGPSEMRGRPFSPKERSPMERMRGHLEIAAFSADSKRVATVSTNERGCMVMVFGTGDGRPLARPIFPREPLVAGALSPDGRRFAGGDAEGRTRLWDVGSGKELVPALDHSGALEHLVFSSNGKQLLTASEDNTARVWDAQTGQPITPFLPHDGRVSFATFSPDGQRVLTASWDGTARLWAADSGEPLAPPLVHTNQVNFAAFSPDGRRAITASADGTARLWRFTPEDKPVEELAALAELLSGRRIDRTGSLTTAPLADVLAGWTKLQKKYPALFAQSVDRARLWHSHEARHGEEIGDWYSVVFHLEQLAELDSGRPPPPPIRLRLEQAREELKKSLSSK